MEGLGGVGYVLEHSKAMLDIAHSDTLDYDPI